MQIPILNGIYTDENSDFRVSYPRNMVPVAGPQGISAGYLRPAPGITQFATVPGVDRGGINWNGTCYRVTGDKFISIGSDGLVDEIGTITGSDIVSFDYSFDRLAIAAGGYLYYFDGMTMTRVVDPDLGSALDVIWVDGYFMTTDGEFLVVTDISDPTSVNPLKYGSSEADPDPIKALLKLRNEPHAINRYTIEVFDNVGGAGFPFERIEGAQIQRGVVGTHACCLFLDSVAFLGGGRDEPVSVWVGSNGSSTKIATQEIDRILSGYAEYILADVLLESKVYNGNQQLLIHLPDKTLAYDATASQALGQPVWFTLSSSVNGHGKYRAINHVWCYGKWLVGDPLYSRAGILRDDISSHWGNPVGWEFGTTIIYNEGRGAIFHEIEIVTLAGRSKIGADCTVWTDWTTDGESWSQRRSVQSGKKGDRAKRLIWLQQGNMEHWRAQRFSGTSEAHISVARLEARIEGLQ